MTPSRNTITGGDQKTAQRLQKSLTNTCISCLLAKKWPKNTHNQTTPSRINNSNAVTTRVYTGLHENSGNHKHKVPLPVGSGFDSLMAHNTSRSSGCEFNHLTCFFAFQCTFSCAGYARVKQQNMLFKPINNSKALAKLIASIASLIAAVVGYRNLDKRKK